MRKLKFRAFVHKYQSISIVDSIDFENKEILFGVNAGYMETDSESANFEDIELMQYTGVCDEDGKEIYEGDIIQVYNNVGIVEYSDTGYSLRYNDGNIIGLYSWNTKKVIGNIYENPDLIKSLPF